MLNRSNSRHGHLFSLESRAVILAKEGLLTSNAVNSLEAGKFFPATESNLSDPIAPNDVRNALPPPDGKIASAGYKGGNAEKLDEPGTQWRKHNVKAGATVTMSWSYAARHLTRRWVYFITKPDWDPNLKLSRAQFEDQPFVKVELLQQPYWSHSDALLPPEPTVHDIVLPGREGYHVLLAIWEVADTGMAFYQVVDLNFEKSDEGIEPPTAPQDLHSTHVTQSSVTLNWSASTSSSPIKYYTIYRNGFVVTITKDGLTHNYTDNIGLTPNTEYTYMVSANNHMQSPPSNIIVVKTAPKENTEKPNPPRNLHSMGQTSHSVALMWLPPSGSHPIKSYHVYRDGIEVEATLNSQLNFTDTGLFPSTQYHYFVVAMGAQGESSLPSNTLTVTTEAQNGSGVEPWTLGTQYTKNVDLVSYNGSIYKCLQSHIATPGWEPTATENILWVEQ